MIYIEVHEHTKKFIQQIICKNNIKNNYKKSTDMDSSQRIEK